MLELRLDIGTGQQVPVASMARGDFTQMNSIIEFLSAIVDALKNTYYSSRQKPVLCPIRVRSHH